MKVGDRRYDEQAADRARLALSEFCADFETQAEAAKELGISQPTLSRSLDPRNQPTLIVLIPLARATHRKMDEILGLNVVPFKMRRRA